MANLLEFNGIIYGVNLENVIDTNEKQSEIISGRLINVEKLEKLAEENDLILLENEQYFVMHGEHDIKNIYVGKEVEIEDCGSGIGRIKTIDNVRDLIERFDRIGLKVTNMDFYLYTLCEDNKVENYIL